MRNTFPELSHERVETEIYPILKKMSSKSAARAGRLYYECHTRIVTWISSQPAAENGGRLVDATTNNITPASETGCQQERLLGGYVPLNLASERQNNTKQQGAP